MLKLITAQAADTYRLHVGFSDGRNGIADLTALVAEPNSIFKTLSSPEHFRRCRIEAGALHWSDSLDLAPEYLYFLAFRDDPALSLQFKQWGYL